MTKRISEAQAAHWAAISDRLRQISELIGQCQLDVVLKLKITEGPALALIDKISDVVAGAAYLFTPQTEWTGGDSSEAKNFMETLPHIAKGNSMPDPRTYSEIRTDCRKLVDQYLGLCPLTGEPPRPFVRCMENHLLYEAHREAILAGEVSGIAQGFHYDRFVVTKQLDRQLAELLYENHQDGMLRVAYWRSVWWRTYHDIYTYITAHDLEAPAELQQAGRRATERLESHTRTQLARIQHELPPAISRLESIETP